MADYNPNQFEVTNPKPGVTVTKSMRMAVLDALYAEYGQMVAAAERTSHNTRMAYHDKADGILKAIMIVEEVWK